MDGAYHWAHAFDVTKWNLRRTYVSTYPAGAATNYATHGLYNTSTSDRTIILRGFNYAGFSGTSPLRAFWFQTSNFAGVSGGINSPLWPGQPAPAGQHFFFDTAQIGAYLTFAPTTNGSFFGNNAAPIAILPPGWAFMLQAGAIGQTVTLSWYWEELNIHDPHLDYQ